MALRMLSNPLNCRWIFSSEVCLVQLSNGTLEPRPMRRWSTLCFLPVLFGTTAFACASEPRYPTDLGNDKKDAKVEAALKKRAEKQQRLAKIKPELREACAMKEGECVMFTRERRNDLLRGRQSYQCQDKAEEERTQCEFNLLIQSGGYIEDIRNYYEYDNWCLDQIIACTGNEKALAIAREKQEIIRARRMTFDGAPHNQQSQLKITVVEAKVKYLRSTLPPQADKVCRDEGKGCNQRLEQAQIAYEKAVVADAAEYDKEVTLGLHQAIGMAEVSCYEPELTCLMKNLRQLGEHNESRPQLEQNLKLVEERETVGYAIDPGVKEQCELQAVQKHQNRIVDTYGKSLRSPGPFFRFQLHKAFNKLLTEQLRCVQKAAR